MGRGGEGGKRGRKGGTSLHIKSDLKNKTKKAPLDLFLFLLCRSEVKCYYYIIINIIIIVATMSGTLF